MSEPCPSLLPRVTGVARVGKTPVLQHQYTTRSYVCQALSCEQCYPALGRLRADCVPSVFVPQQIPCNLRGSGVSARARQKPPRQKFSGALFDVGSSSANFSARRENRSGKRGLRKSGRLGCVRGTHQRGHTRPRSTSGPTASPTPACRARRGLGKAPARAQRRAPPAPSEGPPRPLRLVSP